MHRARNHQVDRTTKTLQFLLMWKNRVGLGEFEIDDGSVPRSAISAIRVDE